MLGVRAHAPHAADAGVRVGAVLKGGVAPTARDPKAQHLIVCAGQGVQSAGGPLRAGRGQSAERSDKRCGGARVEVVVCVGAAAMVGLWSKEGQGEGRG